MEINVKGGSFLIDDEDYDLIKNYKWYLRKKRNTTYVIGYIPPKNKPIKLFRLHRILMGVDDKSLVVDHIDHNGLNNQKSNLRICNNAENSRNRISLPGSSSKYLGVTLKRRKLKSGEIRGYWEAAINVAGIGSIHLGRHQCEIEAAKAYDIAARKYFGKFANPNFPAEVS